MTMTQGHEAQLKGGQMICACGWVSAKFAMAMDAVNAYLRHLRDDVGVKKP